MTSLELDTHSTCSSEQNKWSRRTAPRSLSLHNTDYRVPSKSSSIRNLPVAPESRYVGLFSTDSISTVQKIFKRCTHKTQIRPKRSFNSWTDCDLSERQPRDCCHSSDEGLKLTTSDWFWMKDLGQTDGCLISWRPLYPEINILKPCAILGG